MRERDIEQKMIKAIRKRGGLCPKWVSPGLDGVPDRMLLLPGGRIAFAELKAPGKTIRTQQRYRKAQLERLGFRVYVIDSTEQIGGVLDELSDDRCHPAHQNKKHSQKEVVDNEI